MGKHYATKEDLHNGAYYYAPTIIDRSKRPYWSSLKAMQEYYQARAEAFSELQATTMRQQWL